MEEWRVDRGVIAEKFFPCSRVGFNAQGRFSSNGNSLQGIPVARLKRHMQVAVTEKHTALVALNYARD